MEPGVLVGAEEAMAAVEALVRAPPDDQYPDTGEDFVTAVAAPHYQLYRTSSVMNERYLFLMAKGGSEKKLKYAYAR